MQQIKLGFELGFAVSPFCVNNHYSILVSVAYIIALNIIDLKESVVMISILIFFPILETDLYWHLFRIAWKIHRKSKFWINNLNCMAQNSFRFISKNCISTRKYSYYFSWCIENYGLYILDMSMFPRFLIPFIFLIDTWRHSWKPDIYWKLLRTSNYINWRLHIRFKNSFLTQASPFPSGDLN